MDALQEKLASTIKFRESERQEEARQLLTEFHSEYPPDPRVDDLLGLERKAIPFYEKAIEIGLHGNASKSALLGLGGTYRCTGEYQKSIDTFQNALTLFPDSHEFNVFLGMADYNIGENSKAMELLLNSIADTSQDEGVLRYQRALRCSSDKLSQIW